MHTLNQKLIQKWHPNNSDIKWEDEFCSFWAILNFSNISTKKDENNATRTTEIMKFSIFR